jgi:DNA (cytosine-5)-methyltransferase 1
LVQGMAVRRLTPRECERLQGFPDDWTAGFSDSVRYRMLGNAVCVSVSEWIARRMPLLSTPAAPAKGENND